MQHCNLLCLPENYQMKYYFYHGLSWPQVGSWIRGPGTPGVRLGGVGALSWGGELKYWAKGGAGFPPVSVLSLPTTGQSVVWGYQGTWPGGQDLLLNLPLEGLLSVMHTASHGTMWLLRAPRL